MSITLGTSREFLEKIYMDIDTIVATPLEKEGTIWFGPKGKYWSNLNSEENAAFIESLSKTGSDEAVRKFHPKYYDVIFSPKRAAGVNLLNIKPGDIVVDAGCMWGALTVPVARMGADVIGIEQTESSLRFLEKRITEEGMENIFLICSDLKQIRFVKNSVDHLIMNGVLEWIPELNDIELKKYFGRHSGNHEYEQSTKPGDVQAETLRDIYNGLKTGGNLYLAIENRYDWMNFFGKPDPHCNIPFITVLPRRIQDLISRKLLGRPYRNWIYSKTELKRILRKTGFRSVTFYHSFPDYRFPDFILTKGGLTFFNPFFHKYPRFRTVRLVLSMVDYVLFTTLKLGWLCPSFIIIAKK